jgi:hypothetical protein
LKISIVNEQYEDNLNDEGDPMGSTLRKLKREKKAPSPFDTKLMEAWNRGFSAGAREQNKQDTELMLEWLGKLEEIPGIGEKTAWKIREHYLDFMKEKRERNDLHFTSSKNKQGS